MEPQKGKSKGAKIDYAADVEFALDELDKQCGHFFKSKGVAWKKVRSEFKKEARKIKSDQDHYRLLVRLLARVRDGHARVELTESNRKFIGPEDVFPAVYTPGLFMARVGKKYYVRNVRGDAAGLGLLPGMEVIKLDGKKIAKWAEERAEHLRDQHSFSTDHQEEFYTLNWGTAHTQNMRLKVELKKADGKGFKRTITCTGRYTAQDGPVAYPGKVETTKDLYFVRTEEGLGYVHVRRCKSNLTEQMDTALAALGGVSGLVLDFRGNSGGSFDHDEFIGRFIPTGETFHGGGKKLMSSGEAPYSGPIVVIVDGTVRSAGETAAGMFKEDGRGYMIGESPTAGMSASKERIVLPSGLFQLYVAVHSNKAYFQGGRGIEGIGVEPHELVPMVVEDLVGGKDTQVERAFALLRDYPKNFPKGKVPYDPKKFGWKAPELGDKPGK